MGKRKQRPFDFARYHRRHIALKVAYLGMRYRGFASSGDEASGGGCAVEDELFASLKTACLVESRETAEYSRCGRTDRGVSAFGQVVALHVRTNLTGGCPGFVPNEAVQPKRARDGAEPEREELDYVNMLNRLLPDDIRVVAWSAVPADFNARFSCAYRRYRYYFVPGGMDLERMARAAALLEGDHDFRNFCKFDMRGGVTNFTRRIQAFSVERPAAGADPTRTVCALDVRGHAFLYHQVRCMASVLFMVGEGKEEPEVVSKLLDVERQPQKPFYNMASELPLVLHECGFAGLEWSHSARTLARVADDLHAAWARHALQAAMIGGMLDAIGLASVHDAPGAVPFGALPAEARRGRRNPKHVPLLSRGAGDTFEVRLAEHTAKVAAKEAAAAAAAEE